MKNERKPRHLANKLGITATAQHYFYDTWIEPEAFCYGGKGMLRYAKCINAANGKHVIVKCGLPDSLFSVPATGGFVMHQIEGNLRYLAYFPESMHTDRKTQFTIGDVVMFKTRMEKRQSRKPIEEGSEVMALYKEWQNFEMHMTVRGIVVGMRSCRDERETVKDGNICSTVLKTHRMLLVATTIGGAPFTVRPGDVVIVQKSSIATKTITEEAQS